MSGADDAMALPPVGRSRPKKAPNAFRTISEVADELHIPQHVLRFWETKFPQVKPLKRGGGRRYYRPDDIALLRRIPRTATVTAISRLEAWILDREMFLAAVTGNPESMMHADEVVSSRLD